MLSSKVLTAKILSDLYERLYTFIYLEIMAQTEISSFEEATIFGEKETTFEVVKEGGADSDLQNACTSKGGILCTVSYFTEIVIVMLCWWVLSE